MVIVDAHGKEVQNNHYILRDPADDVKVARGLVKAALEPLVSWPSDQDVEELVLVDPDWKQWLDHVLGGMDEDDDDDGEDEESEGSDDEQLEYFEGGEKWGIKKQLEVHVLALLDLPANSKYRHTSES